MITIERVVAALAIFAGVFACGGSTVVEPDPVPADYTSWSRVDTSAPVPGHGDSYRIIYTNAIAELRGVPVFDPGLDASPEDPDGGSTDDIDTDYNYQPGSIIVKEVHELDGDQAGPINYIAVMRKLEDAPSGAELFKSSDYSDGGWLFTYLAEDINSDEEYRSSCWNECHVAAPIDGTFLDYGQ